VIDPLAKYEGDILFGLLLLVMSLLAYFIPTAIAVKRQHRNTTAIVVLNIFAGWTFVGWVVALVWAFTTNVRPAISERDYPCGT
jgi:uncharacterized membrane protein HdeD (DUF308 family)